MKPVEGGRRRVRNMGRNIGARCVPGQRPAGSRAAPNPAGHRRRGGRKPCRPCAGRDRAGLRLGEPIGVERGAVVAVDRAAIDEQARDPVAAKAEAGAPLVSFVSPCINMRQSGTPRAGKTGIVLVLLDF
jgi:hypothetical protein